MVEALLRRLPPELAHEVTVRALSLGLGGRADDLPGEAPVLFDKPVPNRIGLSGGADKEARALAGWRRIGFGFVEAGTVTVSPREGRPRPRVWRIGDDALVNAMGLPNRGIEVFAANLARYRAGPGGRDACVGASVATPDKVPGEMRRLGRELSALADFLTLNASCPNTEHDALDMTDILAQLAELREGAGGVPILVKLGPTAAEGVLDVMVEAFLRAGVQGFVACNTAPNDVGSLLGAAAPRTWPTYEGKPLGGYSGPGLAPVSLRMVERIRSLCGPGLTVIGVGGVQNGDDLKAMIRAGADAVEVYTAVARGGRKALDGLRRADAELRAVTA